MPRKFIPLVLLSLLIVRFAPVAEAQQSRFSGVRRIIAIGDVHGDYDQLRRLLQSAGVIDEDGHWIAGETHLVFTGDLVDRGPNSAKVLDLVMDIEDQAADEGGMVHVLLGNHEAMNLYGDLRYVAPEDFASYRTPNSERLREQYKAALLTQLEQEGQAPKTEAEKEAFDVQFEQQIPLGWVEQRQAFAPNGKYGKWLLDKNAVIQIDDTLFLHGGISAKYAKTSLDDINKEVRKELEGKASVDGGIVTDEQGPLWYRDLAEGPEVDPAILAGLDAALKTHQARRMVIGHTFVSSEMHPRFDGRVFAIDVGIADIYGGGMPAALLIESEQTPDGRRTRLSELKDGQTRVLTTDVGR